MSARQAWGNVNADGKLGEGSENIAKVDHESTGLYLVTYAKRFASTPAVSVTPVSADVGIFLTTLAEDTFICRTSRNGGPVDAAFSFLAIGHGG